MNASEAESDFGDRNPASRPDRGKRTKRPRPQPIWHRLGPGQILASRTFAGPSPESCPGMEYRASMRAGRNAPSRLQRRFAEPRCASPRGWLERGRRYEIASEMEDNPERDARAIDGLARVTQADVVHLRTQSDMRSHADIDAAAKSKGKLIGSGRSASIPSAQP